MAKVGGVTGIWEFRSWRLRGLLRRAWDYLPRGGRLSDEVWRSRHRFLLGLTWFHAILIALIGPILGHPGEFFPGVPLANGTVQRAIAEGLTVALCAAIATWGTKRRTVRATAVAFGLMSSSAILVHSWGGYFELHFHFIAMVAFLALYQDWVPYLFSLGYLAVHHFVFGTFWSEEFLSHPTTLSVPWAWAGIDAFFALCIVTAGVVAWRFNENATARSKLILDSVGDGIFGLDREGKVTFVNPVALRLLGWQSKGTVGQPISRVLRCSRLDGSVVTEKDCPLLASVREGTSHNGDGYFHSLRDGKNFPVDFVSTPIIEGSRIKGSVVCFRDVTLRREADEKLRHAGELETLHEINRTILESLDVNLMMEGILHRVFDFGRFDIGMICLVTADGHSIEPVAQRGFGDATRLDRYRVRQEQRTKNSIVDYVLTTRQIRIVDLSRRGGVRTFREEGTRSLLIVPLRTEREALGIMYLGRRDSREFQDAEIRVLDAIGLQVGIAIQKSRLFERAAKKSSELETLACINRDLAGQLDNEALLPRIVQEAKKTLRFDGAFVRLLEDGELVLVSASTPKDHEGRERVEIDESLSGTIVGENRVLAISNVLEDETIVEEHRQLCIQRGYYAFVGIPLRVGDKVIGALNCVSRRARVFRHDEIELMTAFADQAAIAIHNARLFGQIQGSRSELEIANRKLRRLLEDKESLYAALMPLAAADSLYQMLDRVIERIVQTTGAEAGLVRLLDETTKNVVCAAQRGFPFSFIEATGFVPVESVPGRVFAEGVPIISGDIVCDPRFLRKAQLDGGFRSCAYLPLKVGNATRGVVHLASRERGFFSEDQRDQLMAIVRQMGIAMENRELFDALNASKLELQRSNADLEQFASVASHDLQEPLRMVAGYTRLLAQRYKSRLDADADEFIGFAVNGANRMLALIQGLLEFSRVGCPKSDSAPADCALALQVALAGLRASIEESGALVTYDPLPQVIAEESQLVRLFQNLISNGIKYQTGGRPEIHVSCKYQAERWVFSVKDNGIGIDPRYTERIFLIFQRLHTQNEYPGTGIGLALCKKIVERGGGKIWVESEPGKGSEFFFTLPARPMSGIAGGV